MFEGYRLWIIGIVSLLILGACALSPDKLSPAGQALLEQSMGFGLRNHLRSHPQLLTKIPKIREELIKLQDIPTITTVKELKVEVDKIIRERVKDPLDRGDLLGLSELLYAFAQEQMNSGTIDGLDKLAVKDYVAMVLRILPPV